MKRLTRAGSSTLVSAIALSVTLAPLSAALPQAPAAPAAPSAAGQTPAAGAMGAPAPAAGAPPARRDPLEGADLSPKPPVPHRTPAEEQKLFQLKPGYSMTPVLTDPQIQQPGAIAFDADGAMYVLELRTYMLDADAKDELAPRSRVSKWEDKDGDGVYETGTVFVDNLIFPRFMTPLGKGQVIIKESNSDDTWLYTDTNGDGKADKKELFTTGLGRSGNVEHQESHLTWAMDNWMYSTYNSVRVRWTPNGTVLKEPTGVNNAAWGVTQDNYGKPWFQNGASGLPSYFQFPIVYGVVNYPDQLAKGFNVPYGAPIGTADMQGGMRAVRPSEGSLNATTAGSGANIYRGDRLPQELVGDYFYGEVVGRVLRRAHPTNVEGLTQLSNPYQAQQSEFIRSMDPLFRPVDNKTAPDGTIYIVDMYHGIIQEGEWAQPGTYLRAKIEQYKLDTAINMGRIWRLTYQGMPRDTTKPHMFEDPSAKLVTYLAHPNGWWRDTAQQQLVLRQDKSVVPALKTMAASSKNQLARIHALWTLEGLNALDANLVRAFMKDADPQIRQQGIRVSETLYKAGDKSFAEDYKRLANDPDVNVDIQALLTMGLLKTDGAAATAAAVKAAKPAKGIQLVAERVINPPKEGAAAFSEGDNPAVRTPAELAVLEQGAKLFADNCTECHGADGQGQPDGGGGLMAPPLAGNLRVQASPEHVLRVLLSGLTDPINGKTYAAGVMVPQRSNSDEWIAAVASFIRNGFNNNANLVTPDMVAFVRADEAKRTQPYTDAELAKVQPQALPTTDWKVTASSSGQVIIGGTANPKGATTLEGWVTAEAQKPGQWFQVELPKVVNLAGIDYQAVVSAAFSTPGAVRTGPQNFRAPRKVYVPKNYKIEVSTDGSTWKTIKEGAGTSMYNSYVFPTVQAKFVKITQTGTATDGELWGMRYFRLFEKPAA